MERKKCVLIFFFANLSKKFLILRRIKRNSVINVHRSTFKVHVIFVKF